MLVHAIEERPTQPLQQEWSPFLFPVEDLPTQGLTDLQIGFDLMDEGELWIDQVQVYDLWFQEIERDSLLKSIALADFQVQEGKVGDGHIATAKQTIGADLAHYGELALAP